MFFDNGVAIKQKKLLPNYFEVSRKKRDLFFHLIYFSTGIFIREEHYTAPFLWSYEK